MNFASTYTFTVNGQKYPFHKALTAFVISLLVVMAFSRISTRQTLAMTRARLSTR